MAEMFGKANGCSRGRGGSMRLFDASRRFYGGYAIVSGLGQETIQNGAREKHGALLRGVSGIFPDARVAMSGGALRRPG